MDFLFKLMSLIMLVVFATCVLIVAITETGAKAERLHLPTVLHQLK